MTDPLGSSTNTIVVPAAAAQPVPAAAAVAAQPQAQAPAQPAPDLQAVAEALRQAFQPVQTDLHFQVDKVTGQLVISVIDAQDGKTLLQIPGEEALAIAQSLEQRQASLIQRQA
jgi:flagellar protein FlaG